jgi:nucleoside-diphosphate-sugar epimerase/glycosyltransferase involved in cell wall biosynthesis
MLVQSDFARKISLLRGPILVLGASGFVGANLLKLILQIRSDAYGTAFSTPAWRLEEIPAGNVITVDLLVPQSARAVMKQIQPGTVFDCVAYGAYSFEQDPARMYDTNIVFKVRLMELMYELGTWCYIHAGSSSEYGENADRPAEDSVLAPNSHYAVTKASCAGLVYFWGKHRGLRCANLRLYSVYGQLEEPSRLIPALISAAQKGGYPPLVDPGVSRDFLYVEDACESFVDAALSLTPEFYGHSFNIGTGISTSIGELALMARDLFHLDAPPVFASMPNRSWDFDGRWCANATKAASHIGWTARTSLSEGLFRFADWYRGLRDPALYHRHAKGHVPNPDESITAIVACYKDQLAVPIICERLVKVFEKLHMDYELIFVNDGSPDNTQEVIQNISIQNHRVIGITHSRNFGSQAAFRSGMELSSKRACVLLDGDLQDPPELIEQFVEKWRQGYDVVYGRRVRREAPWFMHFFYKAFYVLFNRMSYVRMPRDAGDFSLIDRKVVRWMLTCRERDLFLRGIRAFVGFKQTGVDYVRPERMFGRSTNSLLKNFGWAKKGIFSFSNVPLNMLTYAGLGLFFGGAVLALGQVVMRLAFPDLAPKGLTTVIILIVLLGSINLLAVSVIGEYIAKIFEEVKSRPVFIRMNVIQNGEIRQATIHKGE